MNTKQYNKLPKQVNDAIAQFTQSSCLLVPKYASNNSAKGNCHYNVREQVQLHGGKIINGWLLHRNSMLINMGNWHWSFHSVWQNSKGELYDITYDPNNTRDFSTFIPDANRTIDLVAGVSYNDIAIFEHNAVTEPFMQAYSLNYGEVYWTSSSQFIPSSAFGGQYRLLRPEFAHNYALLEQKYGLKVVNGKLVSLNQTDNVPVSLFFEYSLSSRR